MGNGKYLEIKHVKLSFRLVHFGHRLTGWFFKVTFRYKDKKKYILRLNHSNYYDDL